jgi:Zn-dependent protease with chaperone function
MRGLSLLLALMVAGCMTVEPTETARDPNAPANSPWPTNTAGPSSVQTTLVLSRFAAVVRQVEPVAERECRRRTTGMICDFKIVIDDNEDEVPNAFQTLDKNGRPVIAFNIGLIRLAQNEHELAFVLGHEAAHHIRGHLVKQRKHAAAGALIFGGLATLTGGDAESVKSAQELGAVVGARSYSKDFELEADTLGTAIAKYSGYDPLVGARFFTRIPDPGDRFLGTHPPNRQRMDTVRNALNAL